VERGDQAADKAVNEPEEGRRSSQQGHVNEHVSDGSRKSRLIVRARCNLRCVYCMPEEGSPLPAPGSCHIVLDAAAGDCCSFRKLYSGVFVMQAGKNRNGGDPEYDVELMAEKQVLGFKPAARLEQVDG
jgi:hypothetical protein